MDKRKTVLIVDDSQINRLLLQKMLKQKYKIIQAENGKQAIDFVADPGNEISAVLLDLCMPVMDGYAFLKQFKNISNYKNIPVIVITEASGTDSEVEAIKLGADDFLKKPYEPLVINQRLKTQIFLHTMSREQERSKLDSLTDIYNRAAFTEAVNKSIAELSKEKESGIFFIVDIDNFKKINDTYGHVKGDEVLTSIADVLKETFRKNDTIGRLGGDEFVVFVPAELSVDTVIEKGNRLCSNFMKSDKTVSLSCSVGAAIFPVHGATFSELYEKADIALYQAKQLGKNQCAVFDIENKPLRNAEWTDKELLFDAIDDFVHIVDFNTYEMLYANEASQKAFGIPKDYIGKPCYQMLYKRSKPCNYCTNRKLSYDRFYCWEFDSEYFKSRFVLKDKLINWNGRKARLEIAVDIGKGEYAQKSMTMDAKRKELIDAEKYHLLVDYTDILPFDYDAVDDTMRFLVMEDNGVKIERIINHYTQYLPKTKVLPSEDIGAFIECLTTASGHLVNRSMEYRADLLGKGEYTPYRADYVTLADEKGEVYRVIGTSTPMHEFGFYRKDEEYETFKAIAKASSTGVFRINVTRNFALIYANDAFFEARGYESGRIEEKFLKDSLLFIYDDDRQKLARYIENAVANKVNKLHYDARIICKDNSMKWVRCSAGITYTELGAILNGIEYDITEQKNTQQELIKSSEKFENIVTNVPNGIMIVNYRDGQFRPTYVSDEMCRMFQWSRKEILQAEGSHILSAVHPEDLETVKRQLFSCKPIRRNYECTIRIKNKSNVHKWIHLRVATLEDRVNGLQYYMVFTDVDELKKSELEAIVQRKKFETALIQTDLHVWEYDIANRTCYRSARMIEFTGCNETIMQNYPDCLFGTGRILPESEKEYKRIHRDIINGKPRSDGKVCVKNADGNYEWLDINYTVIFDNGIPIKAVGTSENLTDKIFIEQRYKDELAYHEQVEDSISASCKLNLTSEIVEEINHDVSIFNSHEEKMQIARVIAALCKVVIDDSDKKRILKTLNPENLRHSYARGEKMIREELRIRKLDGSICWMSLSATLRRHPKTGDIIAFFCLRDINAQKIASVVMDSVISEDYEFICYIDGNHDINVSIRKESGTDSADSLEYDNYTKNTEAYAEKWIPNMEERKSNLKDMSLKTVCAKLETATSYSCFSHLTDPVTGKETRKKLTFRYIDREKKLIILTRTDITDWYNEEVRKNETLKIALDSAQQASVAKSAFLSGMSHEIRTPMNAIIGLTTLLSGEKNIDVIDDSIQKINSSAKFLLSLINNILDMSRIESGKTSLCCSKTNLDNLLNELTFVFEAQAAIKHLHFEVRNETEHLNILTDSLKLQQVLMNILSNAIKFTPENGTVQFHVSKRGESENNWKLRFEIADNGIGMSEEFLPKLFEPFEQDAAIKGKNYGGTGLGLSICKNIVELMGGTIRVKSTVGKGTVFIIDIDFIKEDSTLDVIQEPCAEIGGSNSYDFSGVHVLVVEDHPINAEVEKRLLERKGIIVALASNGKEAVEKFIESQASQKYDLILMDERMPVMDGFEATRKIRALDGAYAKTVPIVAMTANAFEDDVAKSLSSGMSAHLSKPIDEKKLYDTINEYTKNQQVKQ